MNMISEHYRLEDCTRRELEDLRDLWAAYLLQKRDHRTLLSIIGHVGAVEMLAEIKRILAVKYPDTE
jgi:hypothetical protein